MTAMSKRKETIDDGVSIFMKPYLLVATCLILAGCGRQEQNHREVLGKLTAIESELATSRGGTVRWAFANRRQIDSTISQWSRNKMEEVKKGEGLSPEIEERFVSMRSCKLS